MTFLLDTNAWLRIIQSPEEINARTRELIGSETIVGLSPQSIVEVAQKWSKTPGIISIPLEEWVDNALAHSIELMPITPEIACEAYKLRDFHGDPADRIITATARIHRITIVTSDRRLLAHPDVKTLSTR